MDQGRVNGAKTNRVHSNAKISCLVSKIASLLTHCEIRICLLGYNRLSVEILRKLGDTIDSIGKSEQQHGLMGWMLAHRPSSIDRGINMLVNSIPVSCLHQFAHQRCFSQALCSSLERHLPLPNANVYVTKDLNIQPALILIQINRSQSTTAGHHPQSGTPSILPLMVSSFTTSLSPNPAIPVQATTPSSVRT